MRKPFTPRLSIAIFLIALCTSFFGHAQLQGVGVNITGANPDASSIFDASSTSKGILIPRMTTTQRDAIHLPATGLEIYNTDCNAFNYFNGTAWVPISATTGSLATPGSITGSTTPCANASGITYSIAAVNNATNYTWVVPAGASVTAGQGTMSITVSFGTSNGNICVWASNACETSNPGCTSITLQNAPAVPAASAASNVQLTQFSANWSSVANATTYYLDVSTDTAFGSFVTGFNSFNAGNVTTTNVTGLSCNTAYYYRVRSGGTCGTSANSGTISTSPQTAPSPPTANAASGIQQTQFSANWTSITGASTYYLDVSTDVNFGSFVSGYHNFNAGNVTTTNVTGLTCNTNYFYRVMAVNTCGSSAVSGTISVTTSACCSYTWTSKATFPGGGRDRAVGFSIGTKGYISIGWHRESASGYNDLWEWDQSGNSWTSKNSIPVTPRYDGIAFSIGTKGYVGMGWQSGGGNNNDLWEWDQTNNTWTQKATFPGGTREGCVGFSIGTKGYISSGSAGADSDLWEWDQSGNSWTQKTSFGGGTNRVQATGFSIGTKGYIGLGDSSSTFHSDFWEWDQTTGTWTQKANFGGTARDGAVGFSIGTAGYVGTGSDASGACKDFWKWDQASNTWTRQADFGGSPRWGATGFSIGNKGYICSGYNNINTFTDIWEYSCQ